MHDHTSDVMVTWTLIWITWVRETNTQFFERERVLRNTVRSISYCTSYFSTCFFGEVLRTSYSSSWKVLCQTLQGGKGKGLKWPVLTRHQTYKIQLADIFTYRLGFVGVLQFFVGVILCRGNSLPGCRAFSCRGFPCRGFLFFVHACISRGFLFSVLCMRACIGHTQQTRQQTTTDISKSRKTRWWEGNSTMN